jgi:damage-control phosphatase, subfamily I
MICLSPECFPCFLHQADLAARAHGAADAARVVLAARVAALLADLPARGEIPAQAATRLQEVIRETLGSDDPFLAVKERHLTRFAETAERAERLVAASADPWSAAVWLAGFGNIMDSGIIEQEAMEREAASVEGRIGEYRLPPRFRERLLSAERVGLLLDNPGEVAFDLPLLSRLAVRGKGFWMGVKGGAVLDDLTYPEAERLGLSAYGELVSNGNRGVGTDLPLCTEDFRRRLHGSDLVLSKGQGNFETLVGRLPNAFFLLRCKCPVISRAVGRPEGDFLLLDGSGRAAG